MDLKVRWAFDMLLHMNWASLSNGNHVLASQLLYLNLAISNESVSKHSPSFVGKHVVHTTYLPYHWMTALLTMVHLHAKNRRENTHGTAPSSQATSLFSLWHCHTTLSQKLIAVEVLLPTPTETNSSIQKCSIQKYSRYNTCMNIKDNINNSNENNNNKK